MTKNEFKKGQSEIRRNNPERIEAAKAWRISRRLLANLVERVHAEIEPQLAEMREVDSFIASGRTSLAGYIAKHFKGETVAPFVRKVKPPLPVLGRAAFDALKD